MKSLKLVLTISLLISFCIANYANGELKHDITEPPLKRTSILNEARAHLGTTYKYGGESRSGFDCSGFTQFVFERTGVNISRTSKEQAGLGQKKKISELNKGDLVFFGEHGTVDHVAIVIRSSKRNLVVVHSTSSKGVIIDDIYLSDYWKKRLLYGVDVLKSK